MNNRRQDDDRLARVEERLTEIYAKVTNGLSDRTKRTEKLLGELHEDHSEVKDMVKTHIHKEEGQHAALIASVEEGTKLIKCVRKFVITGVVTFIGMLITIIGWIIVHSPEIGQLVEHFTNITGH